MPGGQNLILTILGMKGSGKSTLAMEIIRQYPRVLIMDAMGEYDELRGAIVREGPEECIDAILAHQHDRRFLIDCMTLHEQDALDILAVAFEVRDQLIVLEEASLYCDPHSLPDEIARIVRYGRKRQIDLLVIARRPSEVNRELTAQSDVIVTFRQTEPLDIQYLRARMGPEAERARNLPPFRVLVAGDRSRAPLAVLERIDQKQLDFKFEGDENSPASGEADPQEGDTATETDSGF